MKNSKIVVLVAFFALLYGKNLSTEEPKPIGDFFDGKKLTYKIEMKMAVKYKADMKIAFYKTSNDKYKITLSVKRTGIYYKVVTTGFIKDNKLYPKKVTEDTIVLTYEDHATHWYNYQKDGSVIIQMELTNPFTGYSAKGFTFTDKKPIDLLSGVLQQIYNLNFGYELEKLNIVRSDYVLWGVEFKKFKCGEDTCVKLKDKKQEEDFDLYGLKAKLGKDSWPALVTVEKTWPVGKTWLIKDIKMELVPPE
jgi:hypothetical protein